MSARLAASAAALVLFAAACSSRGSADESTSPALSSRTSSVPITSSAISLPTSSATAPVLSQVDRDAKHWLDFNRISVELLLARKFAAQRAIKSGQAAPGACTQLVAAAFDLDDRLPRFGTELNKHPLIQALIEASSKYTIAGSACQIYTSGSVRRDFERGDEFIQDAKREAKRLHTRL